METPPSNGAATRPEGGAFFSSTPRKIFTVADFSADERLMIETAEQFSRKEILPLAEALDKQQDGLMPSLIRKAGELGFCGVDAPEAHGGLGLSKAVAARIIEMLSLNASFSVTLGVTSGIAQIGLVLFGTDEQKARFLPRLTSGEWIGAYCLSETGSGSDALAASTRADREGGQYVLNGTKMWISNAKWADFFLVMAKADGERFSAFLVERDTPGLSVSREEHKMGLKGSSTARVVLEDARIPAGNLLHEEGLGHHVAFNALNIGRFKLSAMSLGPARDAIRLAAAYARERKQFGQSISEFGLIRRKFAEMAARFYAAESMIYRTGSLIDGAFAAHGGSVEGNRRAAEEYAIECSACKVFATEAEAFIVDEALQCYGGYGFTEEFPIARHYRDARVSRIYEGTNEINRLFIASRIVRKAREQGVAARSVGDSFVSELAGKAIGLPQDDQVVLGAQSDLVLLAYAEQSARLRAAQNGGMEQPLYEAFASWANVHAAAAYQMATGDSVTVPASPAHDWEAISDAVYESGGPPV
ncbi:MAG: acyl-CoA dehydrogenase family protein [Fimbriimonadaceae bacterium]|nr:acyl-CoA dehydrogenase family protein [Fimbriimonadaceae bacterium]